MYNNKVKYLAILELRVLKSRVMDIISLANNIVSIRE